MLSVTLGSTGNPFTRLWRAYEQQLRRRPLLIQAATSAVMFGAGDVIAQRFGAVDKPFDTRRAFLTATFGGLVVGPAGHTWYQRLDGIAGRFGWGQPGTPGFLAAKLVLDTVCWNAAFITSFFAWGEVLIDEGGMPGFQRRMNDNFCPTLATEAAVCPPVMAFVFSKVPTTHHLLAVNAITILDVAFLAVVRSGLLWGPSSQQCGAGQQERIGAPAAPTTVPSSRSVPQSGHLSKYSSNKLKQLSSQQEQRQHLASCLSMAVTPVVAGSSSELSECSNESIESMGRGP